MKADRKKVTHRLLRDDPAIESRIQHGTETHRKSYANLSLVGADGKPVDKATVRYRQLDHAFKFGCNLFLLDQFDSGQQNHDYRQAFAKLFNLAVVPLYWSDLEPIEGRPRFAADSEPIYRRPPTDVCLEFCESAGITPKGHPLVWQLFWPSWLGREPDRLRAAIIRRVEQIAERYADRIPMFDCCNEALAIDHDHPLLALGNQVKFAFDVASRAFPESTQLIYNEATVETWFYLHGENSPLYLLMRELMRSHRPKGLGMQFHLFDRDAGALEGQAGKGLDPYRLYAAMDLYAKLDLPLNISEITVPAYDLVDDGDGFQAEVAERLYRIWFSHPSIEAITWWNLVDGTAAFAPPNSLEGENYYRPGLTHYDITPKPAYEMLDRLINREWRSEGSLAYQQGAANQFHGFHGKYELTIETPTGMATREIDLTPHTRDVELNLSDQP